MIYYIVDNFREGPLAQTDDLEYAGAIVDALMRARPEHSINDFWVRAGDPLNGPEYYWDANFRTVFSAQCFEPA